MKKLSLLTITFCLLALSIVSLSGFTNKSLAINLSKKRCPVISLSSPPASLDRCDPNTLTLTSAAKGCGPWTYHFTWPANGSGCPAGSYNVSTSSNPFVFTFPSGNKPCVGTTVSCWITDVVNSSSIVYNFSVTTTCH